MARLLVCEDWTEPDSLAMHLHYDLGDEYVVVADPTVRGRELDVVVVGPQGLFVLYALDGHGRGAVEEEAGEEEAQAEPGPAEGVSREAAEEQVSGATKALEAFLQDEFPSLSPELYHLQVLMEPGAAQSPSGDIPSATPATVAQQISATEVPESGPLLDGEGRDELAVALRDRRLTVSQRASESFVFRSGHALGSGTEVWTVREAVRHMDAHPESGIHHLRNDTLARWFSEQGARHMARLAREVVHDQTDHRVALENFLIRTGLVSRPQLKVRPGQVDLGYLLAGEGVARRVRLGKGRGRGYLFGRLEPSVSWLSVHPREFAVESGWSVVTVRAETESLRISREPRLETIAVHSNAAEEPTEVPVRFRVVGMPSPLNRRLLRPATGLLAAGVLGAGLGWLLTARGAPAGRLLANVAWLGIAPRLVWVLFVALIWAAVGTVRGATQPEAWPVSYAMGRWSCRIVVWAVSLGLLGAAIAWAWAGLRAPGAAGVPPLVNWLIVTVPVALAIFPATIGEIRAGRDMRDTSMRAIRWSFLRPLLAPAVAMVVALVLRLAAPRLRPLWQQVDWAGAGSAVGGWIARQLERLEKGIQTVMDDLYRRYYER